MSFATKAGIIIGAAAFSGMAVAGTGEASNDLQSRLEAAEARIAELSAQQNSDWLTEQRAEQVRGVVQDVLADADTRASLQGTGATSGYNNGFFVQSADGKWSVKINGVFQERFNYAKNGESVNLPNGNHDNAWGFETTRAALNFSGMLAGEAFYNARLNWSPYNGGNQLEWAYGGWKVDDTWSVSLGRQKFDVMRGYMLNAEDQQAIERSLQTTYWATSSVTNGIKLSGNMDQSRYNVMFSNGSGGNANNGYVNNDHDWAISGRGEWLMEGTWGQFDNMSSPAGSTDGWLLGVGAAYNKTNVGAAAEAKNWLVSGDLTYHSDGWNAYGSMTYGKNDPNTGADRDSFGWELGAGMYMDADNELYARYSWLDPGQGRGADSSKLSIMTIGWNHYIAGPNTKLSVDWSYSFSDQSFAANQGNGVGYSDWWNNTPAAGGNGLNDGSNWMIRTQLQVAF
ncbi:MAG: OprO/OprP family phosphate-selective porin [Phycisphaerales bacterium]|nr:OprO/OprP family phosphate-selective porin [Phycisphaerales bacterium]